MVQRREETATNMNVEQERERWMKRRKRGWWLGRERRPRCERAYQPEEPDLAEGGWRDSVEASPTSSLPPNIRALRCCGRPWARPATLHHVTRAHCMSLVVAW